MYIMEKAETATAYFGQGYACSQSVFLAFAAEFGLSTALASQVASGFGGGIGRTGSICGAVSGAIMAIGLKYGCPTAPDSAAKEMVYEQVRRFMQAFQEQHGSLDCNTLLCADISTAEGRAQARETGKFTHLCPLLVRDAVLIADAIIKAPQPD
jgi:C_GCAxxG_C_C family probable redox protein